MNFETGGGVNPWNSFLPGSSSPRKFNGDSLFWTIAMVGVY